MWMKICLQINVIEIQPIEYNKNISLKWALANLEQKQEWFSFVLITILFSSWKNIFNRQSQIVPTVSNANITTQKAGLLLTKRQRKFCDHYFGTSALQQEW